LLWFRADVCKNVGLNQSLVTVTGNLVLTSKEEDHCKGISTDTASLIMAWARKGVKCEKVKKMK